MCKTCTMAYDSENPASIGFSGIYVASELCPKAMWREKLRAFVFIAESDVQEDSGEFALSPAPVFFNRHVSAPFRYLNLFLESQNSRSSIGIENVYAVFVARCGHLPRKLHDVFNGVIKRSDK